MLSLHHLPHKLVCLRPWNRLFQPSGMCTAPIGRLCDKIAIVTGSTDGIGFAIARRFAQEGAHVVLSSRKQKNVDAAVDKLRGEGLKVCGVVCHVAKCEDRKKLYSQAQSLGGLDIVVSNAAVNPSLAPVLDCEESAWDKIFEVNVKAAFLLAKESVPLLRQRKSGRIIFISSIGGFQPCEPFEGLGAYCVSKTAVVGLTKAAATQLAKDNITVNAIAPGIVKTKFSKILVDDSHKEKKVFARVPMKRLATPEDISAAAAFLASSDASYITGETIIVAGGMPSRL